MSKTQDTSYVFTFSGDGEHKPTGLFHAAKGGQVAATTSAQNTVAADELINLVYALKRPYAVCRSGCPSGSLTC